MLSPFSDFQERRYGHFAWFLLLIAAFFFVVRVFFWNIPMERDEGEYATLGLGMLHGIPPFQEAYTMKLPGGAAMYALIFAVLGHSARAIHVGLTFFNAATIVGVGWMTWRLFGKAASCFAAAAYGTWTLGFGMFGLWLSAEHFAAFFLVAGCCAMPLPRERWYFGRFAAGSLLLGCAWIMKQHALLPAMASLLFLGWRAQRQKPVLGVAMGIAFFLIPFFMTCLVMRLLGVWTPFKFWTFTYASRYVSNVPWRLGWEYAKIGLTQVFWSGPLLWLLAGIGFFRVAFRPRISPDGSSRGFLVVAFLFSVAAASLGWMFRGQYFILVAPFAAMLAGAGWIFLWARWYDRRLRVMLAIVSALAAFLPLMEPMAWAARRDPIGVMRLVYGMNPFPEYGVVAQYVREHTRPDDRLAILGSEPSIYFLADRRPALPYLCVYEMMKRHAFARKMQQEAARAIETARPACIIWVEAPTSWGAGPESDPGFVKWAAHYVRVNYTLEGVLDLVSERETVVRWNAAARTHLSQSPYRILIYAKKA